MRNKTVDIVLMGGLRKWDVVRLAGSKSEGVVINAVDGSGHMVVTLYPYKRHKWRLFQWFWMKWLRLRIWLGVIKTK